MCDQKTAETRFGKNVHPKIEALGIVWDHFLDSTRQSWFTAQAHQELSGDASIQVLQQENGFGGTGFAAKNIIVSISVCDSLSGPDLFPALQANQRVRGPNPTDLFAILEPWQNPEECLARFQRMAAARVPGSIVTHGSAGASGIDVAANVHEVCRRKKWTQLNLCKVVQVEEARMIGSFGAHKRREASGEEADLEEAEEEEEDEEEEEEAAYVEEPAVEPRELPVRKRPACR